MKIAVSVRNISKCYKLGVISRQSLVDEVRFWLSKIRGRDPREDFYNIGYSATEARRVAAETAGNESFWALKDVSFDIKLGEVVGVIGKNGSGKSTLLKILSRITEPTSGEVVLNGRVGSLLEVGTGFHPELTGRENIFMNGTILGMNKKYISKKFDEIVQFSGIEKFIDTPVKRYSSGMYVRLAFAVAAHLEPEILVVDEVLAVGDSEFQRKCMGKMQEVAENGRTVLFVSHNMDAIKTLTNTAILLSNGEAVKYGKSIEVVNDYLYEIINSNDPKNDTRVLQRERSVITENKISFIDFSTSTKSSLYRTVFEEFEDIMLRSSIKINDKVKSYEIVYKIRTIDGVFVSTLTSGEIILDSDTGTVCVTCVLSNMNLGRGRYLVSARIMTSGNIIQDFVKDAMMFEIIINDNSKYCCRELSYQTGCLVRLRQEWSIEN